jgi:hydrogenase nickel incorporation protein HypB
MCTTCGCSDHASAELIDPADGTHRPLGGRTEAHGHTHAQQHAHAHSHTHGHAHTHAHSHAHEHEHEHGHEHSHPPSHSQEAESHDGEHGRSAAAAVTLEQEILGKNARFAERNRGWLEGRGILAVNLMSSPGAGKTTLLERTLRDLGGELDIAAVEGDQETALDAERLRATGCRTLQINTGTGCHLEAHMFGAALRELAPPAGAVVMIENVGNLVCPALFDLGEGARVAILSVTEGDDKPLKYPHMFRSCELMLLNKVDLLEHVDFDVERCIEYARRVNPSMACLTVSATTGHGMEGWYGWLRRRAAGSADDRRAEPGA